MACCSSFDRTDTHLSLLDQFCSCRAGGLVVEMSCTTHKIFQTFIFKIGGSDITPVCTSGRPTKRTAIIVVHLIGFDRRFGQIHVRFLHQKCNPVRRAPDLVDQHKSAMPCSWYIFLPSMPSKGCTPTKTMKICVLHHCPASDAGDELADLILLLAQSLSHEHSLGFGCFLRAYYREYPLHCSNQPSGSAPLCASPCPSQIRY